MIRTGRLRTLGVIALTLLTLFGCSSNQPTAQPAKPEASQQPATTGNSTATQAPKPAPAPLKVRMGIIPISNAFAYNVAEKQGFFKEEGLTVEVKQFQAGPQILSAIISGDLEFGYSGVVPALSALARKAPLVIVGQNSISTPTSKGAGQIVVRSDSGINSVKDLVGKRIGTNAIGGVLWLFPLELLAQNGVDASKVTWAELPFPQAIDALLNKQVDAVGLVEPFISKARATGKVKELGDPFAEVQPVYSDTQYLANKKWVDENPEGVKRFVRAMDKAAKYLQADTDRRHKLLAEFGNISVDEVKKLPEYRYEVVPLNVAAVQKTADLMAKWKVIDQTFDIKPYVYKTALGELN